MFKVFMGTRFYAKRSSGCAVNTLFETLEEAKDFGKKAYTSGDFEWVDILDLSTGEFVASCGRCYGDYDDYPLWWGRRQLSLSIDK